MRTLTLFTLLLISFGLASCDKMSTRLGPAPIKVGVLHSQTGPFAYTEEAIMDATLLAIQKVNEGGGVMGKMIQPIVYDGASSATVFKANAEKLLQEEKVSVIFGCLASHCRKVVKDVVEKDNSILFYPMSYEGLERSGNVVYMGATPNQRVLPFVHWGSQRFGKRFYLMGSDTLYSHALNEIIKEHITALGGEIVGEAFFPVNNLPELAGIARDIAYKKPDIVMSNLGRSSCEMFLDQLRIQEITPMNTPIFLFGMSAYKLYSLDDSLIEGAYGCWSYHESRESPDNDEFKERFYAAYGRYRIIDEPMATAYDAVLLWAKVANALNTIDPQKILSEIRHFSIDGASGRIHICADNNNAFRKVRIGRLEKDGNVQVLWDSQVPLRPEPYPIFRTNQEWDDFLAKAMRMKYDKAI